MYKTKGEKMNTNKLISRTIIVFVALAIAGVSVAISAQAVTNTLDQLIMIAIGSAIFGAGLAFFLTRIFALLEK
jgi:choline-glycine betaine transporter